MLYWLDVLVAGGGLHGYIVAVGAARVSWVDAWTLRGLLIRSLIAAAWFFLALLATTVITPIMNFYVFIASSFIPAARLVASGVS